MSLKQVDQFASLSPPYSTIVADPPWDYSEGFATASHTKGAPLRPRQDYDLPYSSMSVADVMRLTVSDLAGSDCRLFLWTTNKYLPDSFRVMDAWGFKYRQTIVWHKLDCSPFSGSVAPNGAEFLMVATKGSPVRIGKWNHSVVSHAQSKKHSVKPGIFGDLVEQCSPGPYLELFARQPRLGWDAWGFGHETKATA